MPISNYKHSININEYWYYCRHVQNPRSAFSKRKGSWMVNSLTVARNQWIFLSVSLEKMCIICWLTSWSRAIPQPSCAWSLVSCMCHKNMKIMIHLSWQMWTCFGKRKVEMCNYGGNLAGKTLLTCISYWEARTGNLGSWHIGNVLLWILLWSRWQVYLVVGLSVGGETATGEREGYHSSPGIHLHSWMHCRRNAEHIRKSRHLAPILW